MKHGLKNMRGGVPRSTHRRGAINVTASRRVMNVAGRGEIRLTNYSAPRSVRRPECAGYLRRTLPVILGWRKGKQAMNEPMTMTGPYTDSILKERASRSAAPDCSSARLPSEYEADRVSRIAADVFDPNESDLQYALRRMAVHGIKPKQPNAPGEA